MNNTLLHELKNHVAVAERLRTQLHISPPGELIYWQDISAVDEEMVVVEADGVGGASLSIVRGRYPFDYETVEAETFPSEDAATKRASELCCCPV